MIVWWAVRASSQARTPASLPPFPPTHMSTQIDTPDGVWLQAAQVSSTAKYRRTLGM